MDGSMSSRASRGEWTLLDLTKFDQERCADRVPCAQKKDHSERTTLTGASYVIGRVLGEVWQEPLMDLDELLIASSMCFMALAEGQSAISFSEISRMSGRKPRRTRDALQKLVSAGFVSRRHPSHFGLESEDHFYEFQLPIDCSVS
jgi:predicted transcriptional regulator